MFLEERKTDNIIEALGLKIITRGVLISKFPLYAIAVKEDDLFLIESLEDNKTDFINEHLLWMRNNMNSFLSKHHIMGNNRINLVCLYGGKEEINLEVPDMKGEIKIYNFNIALTGSGEYQQFNNYTLNIQLIRKMLSDISNSGLDESAKGLFNEIFTQRPLIGWKKAANCSVEDTLKEKYWLYFFRNFFLCHKGKAPFNPKKVLFKEELW